MELMDELATIGGREQWLIRPNEITTIPGQLLGEGAFGRVVLAKYQGIHVAVKVPKIRTKRMPDDSHLVELCDELRVLRRVRHPNIVLFYGAALDEQNRDVALVLELVDGQSVRSFVQGSSGSVPPSALEKSQVLVDVACALQYLHSRTPHIAHGDLKDRNVFVEAPHARVPVRAKLLDFGLSRVLTRHAKPMGGTLSWVAPELLRTMGRATSTTADVFSFGRLAYFVVTGRLPFRGTMAGDIESIVAQLTAPLDWAPGCWLSDWWRPLVEQCTCEEASARPGMHRVYRLARDCHGELLESKSSELPLNIAQLIAGKQASGSAQAIGSAGRPRGSDETPPAATTTSLPEANDASGALSPRVTMSSYAGTPDSTATLLLVDAITSLNLQIPSESCCEFHGTVRSAVKLMSALLHTPCKGWDSMENEVGPIVGQCSQCGVLIRNQQQGSSFTLPAVLECPFCEHQQSRWGARCGARARGRAPCAGAGADADPGSSLVSLTFRPGTCGIELDEATGKVVVVAPGGQAEQLGVKVGWYLKSIDDIPYRMDVVRDAIRGSAPYVAAYQPFTIIGSEAPSGGGAAADVPAAGTLAPEAAVMNKMARALKAMKVSDWEKDVQRAAAERSPEVEVREATGLEDIQGAAKLLAESNPGDGEQQGFADTLVPFLGLSYMRLMSTVSLSSPLTAVAVASNEVIGLAEVKADGYVRNLAVRDDWKRRGIGSRLLCWCAESSRQRGAERLSLHVAVDNDEGVGFYRRLNFTFGQKEFFGPQDDTGFLISRDLL